MLIIIILFKLFDLTLSVSHFCMISLAALFQCLYFISKQSGNACVNYVCSFLSINWELCELINICYLIFFYYLLSINKLIGNIKVSSIIKYWTGTTVVHGQLRNGWAGSKNICLAHWSAYCPTAQLALYNTSINRAIADHVYRLAI